MEGEAVGNAVDSTALLLPSSFLLLRKGSAPAFYLPSPEERNRTHALRWESTPAAEFFLRLWKIALLWDGAQKHAWHRFGPPPAPHLPCSSVRLQEGWLGAEGWDAQRQLDAACDMLNAWQPAHLVLGLPVDGDDFMADTPRARWVGGWVGEGGHRVADLRTAVEGWHGWLGADAMLMIQSCAECPAVLRMEDLQRYCHGTRKR